MSVAACPRCEGQVTMPPGARPAARVKCPLCEEEFALSEIYDKLPPMLILLDAPVEAHTTTGGGMSHGEGAFDSLFVPSADANGDGDLHLAPSEGGDGETSFDFGGSGGGTAVATAPSTKTLPARAKKPPKNPVKEGVKIVLGGVVGLTVGFFILLWGFDRDLCESLAKKPVAEVFPTWLHWSLPAKHKPAAAVAPNDNAHSDTGANDGNVDDAAADDGAADGRTGDDQNSPPAGDTTDNANDRGATATDGTPDKSTPDESKPNESTPDDATANTDAPNDGTGATDDASTPVPPPPKSEGTDDPGSTPPPTPAPPTPTPPPAIDEPTIDIPPPSTPPPVDEPKITDLFPDVDVPGDDAPPADEPSVTRPGEGIPAEESPDARGATDEPNEITIPELPEKGEKKPLPGLKVEEPVDEDALAAAGSVALDAADALMPEDAAAKAAFTREKYASYSKLCEFANSVAHAGKSDAGLVNAEKAKMVMSMIASDDANTRTLGQLANAWLSKTRANDGIALAGKVTAVDTSGSLTTITVELPALEGRLETRKATIVTHADESIKAGDDVTTGGTVVDKPAEKIEGYTGPDSQVIWGAWVGKRAEK